VCLKDDSDVSRYHAVIAGRGDGFWLSDLGARNGTTVNDEAVVSERKLRDGDLICVGGGSTIEFCSPGAQAGEERGAASPPEAEAPAPGAKAAPEQEAPVVVTASPQPPQSSGSPLIAVCGVVGGLALTALVLGLLFVTGVAGGKKSGRTVSNVAELPPQTSPTPDEGRDQVNTPPTPEPAETPEPVETRRGSSERTPEQGPATGPDEITGAAQVMAAKISPKNYRIDPAFAALIGSYVNEYRGAAGYFGRARAYRDVIDKEFVNVQGLPPLFAYVLAMSRSKFVEEGGGGVWRLPASVAGGEAAGADAGLDRPGRSTKIAASYIRGLWDVFGREGFMYAVACYGMTPDEAGELQQRLEEKDPTGQLRYDFWRMKQAGVLKGEQVERVARFFAAGIVAENPRQFGLKEEPLSSLY
jgi:hypothetical protein